VAVARFCFFGSNGLATVLPASRCNSGVEFSSCCPPRRIARATFVTTTPVAATAAAPSAAPATDFTASAAASDNRLFFGIQPLAPCVSDPPRAANKFNRQANVPCGQPKPELSILLTADPRLVPSVLSVTCKIVQSHE
jgi:hypothetical protein